MMKTAIYVFAFLFIHLSICCGQQEPSLDAQPAQPAKDSPPSENPAVDYQGFARLVRELEEVREQRRVPLDQFLKMAKEPRTIILDVRSKDAYELLHFAGAIHLNLTDFSEAKLREVIPDKETRILVHCNNNFIEAVAKQEADPSSDKSNAIIAENSRELPVDEEEGEIITGTTVKLPSLALNIMTFLHLHGYGYENVFELADRLELNDPRLPWVGKAAAGVREAK